MSILSKLSPNEVIAAPFPHVAVENAADPELCRQLIREFPPVEVVTRGRPYKSSDKIYLSANNARQASLLTAAWKRALRDYLQPCVWHDLVRLFRPHLLGEYPDFEQRFGRMDELRVGLRERDDFSKCDVLLDAKALMHTPVTGQPAAERNPHLKRLSAVFFGYLFLRPDEDDSQGADQAFYSLKPGAELLLDENQTLAPSLLNLEKVIPYRRNTFVCFMNTARSIQAITPRSVTDTPYLALHFTVYLKDHLFRVRTKPGVEIAKVITEEFKWSYKAMRKVRGAARRLKLSA